MLVFPGIGSETVFRRELADLAEPLLRVIQLLVAVSEIAGEAHRDAGVDSDWGQALVGWPGQRHEELMEKEAVGGPEV